MITDMPTTVTPERERPDTQPGLARGPRMPY
jgi:hypothetical protein